MTEIRAPYAGRTLPVGTATERDLRDEIAQLRVQIRELDAFNTDLLADVARLKAGLESLRETEHLPAYGGDELALCGDPAAPGCYCGMDERNDRIAALLAGKP